MDGAVDGVGEVGEVLAGGPIAEGSDFAGGGEEIEVFLNVIEGVELEGSTACDFSGFDIGGHGDPARFILDHGCHAGRMPALHGHSGGGFGYSDDGDAEAAAGVADGLGEVVGFGVDDDGAAEDGVFVAGDGEAVDHEVDGGGADGVGGDVAEIASVVFGGTGGAVHVVFGVVVASCGGAVGG